MLSYKSEKVRMTYLVVANGASPWAVARSSLDPHLLGSEWNDIGLATRAGDTGTWKERRLSAVFGAVVNLAIGERECLETIKTSAEAILNVLKRLT
jgi:hypothetical protein